MKKIIYLILVLLPQYSFAMNALEFQEKMKQQVGKLSANSVVSMHFEVLGKNQVLFSHNSNSKLYPASNTKLLSAMAALDKLGPGFTFTTKIFSSNGDLIIQGNGDPYLVSERIWLLARDIARSGIKKVGGIKINNSAFTENYKGLMDWRDSGEPFTAIVSPTSVNFNSLEIHVIPDAKSAKPKIELGPVPHGYATIINEVSQGGGSKKSLSVRQQKSNNGTETFVVSGVIGRDSAPAIVYASVSYPESYIAHVFAALLRSEGVEVEKDFDGASFSSLPGGAKLVAEQESLPLLDLVRLFDTYSNNFMTEQVYQALGAAVFGAPASLDKSKRAVGAFLAKRETCKDADLDNGSGLSWKVKVSSHCYVDSLQNSYRDFRIFADLLGSLPIGGETGTLKHRFKGAGKDFDPLKVRAKTGTIWSKQAVTSLVGFSQTSTGETVVFAILQNDQRNDRGLLPGMREWEDRCVEYIQQLQL